MAQKEEGEKEANPPPFFSLVSLNACHIGFLDNYPKGTFHVLNYDQEPYTQLTKNKI